MADVTVNVTPTEVMYTGISKSKRGYNTAYLAAKRSDGEFISINYEWEGDVIPDFVLDLMEFMKTNNREIASVKEENLKSTPEGILKDFNLNQEE